MALIYRNVTGPISGANGDALATGTLKAKLLSPLVDGTTFVATELVEGTITTGAVTIPLAATGRYEFTVVTVLGDTLWSFQATLGDSSAADISLAELYLQEELSESVDATELYATFLSLLDTPLTYVGGAGLPVVVTAGEDALEYGTTPLVENHSQLGGLDEDQHEHYLLADGTRPLSAAWDSEQQIGVTSILLDTTAGISVAEGELAWNATDKCLDMGSAGGPVAQLPLEEWVRVYNDTGSQIDNGTVVSNLGVAGGRPSAGLADATVRQSSRSTLGIATQDIGIAGEGMVTSRGLVRGINTAAFPPGAPLFLHASIPGAMQAFTSPAAPISTVFIGVCIVQDATVGEILVNLIVNPTLTELVDVAVTNPTTGELLVYNAVTGVFENKVPSFTYSLPLDVYVDRPVRGKVLNQHGGLDIIVTGGALSAGSPLDFNAGISKVMFVVNAGTDITGSFTITGTTVDRDTQAVTLGDTEVITVDALTTDASGTDAQGNEIHDMTGAYISTKWFQDGSQITTTDLNISDMDVYAISFEQFDSHEDITLCSVDITALPTNSSAWFYGYTYAITVTGTKCDVDRIVEFALPAADVSANVRHRKREANINYKFDGTTDGLWMEQFFGPLNATYWEDINTKLWVDITEPLTLS